MKVKHYPLSLPQKNILMAEQYYADTNVNNNCAIIKFKDADAVLIQKAVNLFICNTQAMRLVLDDMHKEPDQAAQHEQDYLSEEFQIRDMGERNSTYKRFIRKFFRTKLNPEKKMYAFMILTFSDGSAELLSILHHLIVDGWGYAEAAKMIYRYYQDLRDGKEPKDRMFDYTPYLEKENEQLKGRKYQRDEQFFNEYLKTKFEPARLSMGSQSDSVAAKRFEKCLTAKEKKILQDLRTKSRQNLMPVMISLYAIYCAKVQSCDRIAFGSPCFNRENEKERKTMGAFVNMLPFVMDVNGTDIFSDLCESAAFTSLQLLRHQRFPYQEIQKIAKEKHDLTEKLYHIMFNFIPMEFEELDAVWMDNGTSQYELCINVTECYEGDIRIAYDYLPEICTEKGIKTIHQAIFLIAEQILEKPQISLEDISIISQKEKKQIEKFNSTEVEYDPRLTVGQMFEKFRQSEETAVVCQDTSISYRQLHLVSDQIARALCADGIGPNDVVALCMKRSVDSICAVFGVVKSGAAFLPMDLEWPKNRREYVLENSQAVYTITDNNFEKLKGLALDTQHEIPVEGKPDDLCYVIYTSGSTGKPKGVMLTQQNAVNFSQPLKYNYLVKEINDKCKTVLSMGNLAFDISISEYFPALLNGKTLILADEKMLSSIESMTEAIRKHQVDCLQCTPSRLLQYLENDSFASSMKQMKVIMAAAEVFPQTLSKKLSEISTAVLMNGYGPTETTMGASYSYVSGDKITIGKPISNVSMYIMNRYGNILPVGRVGELCIGGKGVGKGYLGLPEMTKEKFLNTREYGRIYRTGDFACLNSKGELEFYGRMDQQVKLRGLRIEISEIENVILSYPGISGAAVKIWGEGKDAWLCGYYEAENPLDEDALTSYLSDHLTYYMIPSMLYHMKEIPKSSAGKTDYKNLPAVEQIQEIISCETETQEKLYSILKEVLHTESFGIRTNLFQSGLTSLLVLKLNSMIMEVFGVELNSNELMRNPTILGIEGLLNSRKEAEEPQTAPVGAGNAQEYPLLGSQLGIWMESETKQDEYQYHIPVCFQLSSNIVPNKLQKAVKEALKCHPYLFSYFSKNGVQYPGQAVLKRRHVEDPLVALEYCEEPQKVEFVKPFYVTEPDLYRAGIYYNENEVYFYLDVHHILCDGQSMKILLRDIDRAYHGELLVQEEYDSFAYALEEAAKDQSGSQEMSDYYDRLFKGAEQVSHLRADRNDPVHEASNLVLELDPQTVEEIQQFTRKHAVSLGNFYLSAVEVVLSRYTRTGDIILAAAESGRSFARYENTVGMLVKTLLLRQRIDASDTVTNLMQNVGQNLYENIAHDRIPYARLTGNYGLVPEIMFVYQNQNVEDLCFLEENARMQSLVSQVNARAKFPVSFDISENKIRLEYDKGIYLRKSMQILLDAVGETIKAFLKNPQKKIEDIVIASETERQQIRQFNHTEDSFPESETIVSAFERAAAEHKNETAVYGIDGELTFEELSKRSNRIANALTARGVKKEDIVIVQLKRTTDIICAMFGVLKAGAAYLPLDIENPAERVDYIKKDSNAAFHIQADNIGELLSETDDKYKDAKINGSNLCYCIYTSGSTGKPKGVLVEHGNVLNYALPLRYNHQIHTIVEECSVSVAVGNLAFDIAVAEIYPFLLCGKPVILASEEQISDARKLASVIRKYQADFILCTPTRLLQYLEEPLFAEVMADFKSVSAAGEAVSSEWVRRLREVTKARLYNGYGPTETTAGCTFKEIVSDEINIGSPISNVKAHILDTCLKPVPIQVPGELCITGRGVARGYLNQPELTRKAFIETAEGRMYRTGDIVYWTENGEIQYIGRGDGQIKLRGLRIELGEIEAAISDYPGVHSCAVLVNGTGNQALLCAYYTAESELDAASLKQELGLKLAEYMVPSVFVYLEQMPMNDNGKIDTRLLQKIEIKQEKTACKTETQRQIFSILSEILGTEDFGITTDLYQLGMTSLSAMKINSRLTDLFLVELSSKDIMKHSTVEELEKLVLSAPGIEDGAGETQELYPLTKSQMGIYAEYDKDRNSVSYNMPTLLKFDKNINIDRLLQALETAVEAHPYLKSYIVKQDSDLYLRRNEEAGVAIGRKEIDGQEVEQKEVTSEIKIQGERLIRPFVLEKGPLYRLEVYEGPEAVYLFMDFHHILFDGLSNAVFLEDVKAAYEGHPVLPEIQDAFTFTQKELQEQAKEKAHPYFQNMFADVEEGSKVFFDYPDQGKNHAGYYIRKIPEEMLDKMNQFAAEQRVTPGSLLLSAFLFTVAKYSRNHRVAVGTVENGREKSGYQRSVGMFVRTIPLCVELNKEELAGQYIKRVHRTMLEVSQNASYTYTDFADEFGMNLDTHFVYNENLQTEMRLEDSEAEEIPVLLKDAKFALTFSVSGDICQIDYRSDLYEENTICKFTDSVLHCLDMFMTAEGTALEHLSLAKEEDLEAYRVLNDTDVENDHSMTMDQMFLNAVEKYSDRAAVVCGETDALTYRQLGEAAARIAAGLKKRGIGRGDIAAFCLPRGIGVIKAIFGIIRAGAAVLPVDIVWPQGRKDYVIENSGAKLLITEEVLAQLELEDEAGVPKLQATSEDLSYVLYTSGSTGKPKGAMLIQRNLTNFLKPLEHNCLVREMYQHCQSILSISNITFDISICEIFPAIFYGRKLVFADEKAFDSPRILSEFAGRHKVDCIQGTPSRISQYMEEPEFTKCLRNVKVMLVAGEALNHALTDKIREYSDTMILNGYGPTETTLAASYQYVTEKKITIGKPVANAKMYVVDPWMNLQPQGCVGELCIGGCNVGIGYIKREDLTREKFVPNPFHPGTLYHSGDLARLTGDGEIDFLGRIDSQIKLHGLRIELDEIESVMSSHPLVTACAVKVAGSGKNAYLCGYYMAKEPLPVQVLRDYMGKHLTYYMLPTVMMQLDVMPISTAGKIDRQNLPEIEVSEEIVPCETALQEEILEFVSQVLGTQKIGITTDFFRLGMTSLLAVKINTGLYEKFGVELSSRDILKNHTVVQLESLILQRSEAEAKETEIEKAEEYPLTENQLGVYVETIKNPQDKRYHMPGLYRMDADVDRQKLVLACKKAVAAHSYMNTCVKETDHGPVFVRNDEFIPEIKVQYSEHPDEEYTLQSFELTKAPLYEFAIFYNEKMTCLYFDIHHIIFDGESLSIFMADIKRAYENESVTKEEYTAFDHVILEQKKKELKADEDRAYFLKMFSGAEKVSSVHQDQRKEYCPLKRVEGKISDSCQERLKEYAVNIGVTASSIYLAAFALVISRLTRKDDVIFAAVEDGRADQRFKNSVGMFVRTLPLCIQIEDTSSAHYVQDVQKLFYEAVRHDSYSYARFSSETGLVPEILYVYQNRDDVEGTMGSSSVKSVEMQVEDQMSAKFPITLNVKEPELILEYDPGKYAEETIRQLYMALETVVEKLAADGTKEIFHLSIMNVEQLQQIQEFNQTKTEFPQEDTIVSLFEKQVEKTPEQIALISSDQSLTYRELNKRANRIAHGLRKMQVGLEDIVAVKMKRSTDVLAAFLGIMKAGAAYLPIDGNYPQQRIDYIMEDSQAMLMLDDENVKALLECSEEENLNIPLNGRNLCYVIYTSGSTGKPKGVLAEHRGVMDYALPLSYNLHARTIAKRCHASLAIGSLAFDIAVAEIYPFLFSGKTVILADDRQSNDVVELERLITRYHADALLCTPSRLLQYLEYEPFANAVKGFASITAAGEAVPKVWMEKLKKLTHAKLYNGYGPTETTAGSVFLEMNGDYVNIGRPLSNEQVYIVDHHRNMLPAGIAGELCIAGYGVARGYLNRPQLTKERFVLTPYAQGKMYCTGDMAKWNEQGEIEFIGRIDNQIKYHGYRIELGEIEKVMNDYPEIENSAVVLRNVKGSQYMFAYYTAKQPLDHTELRNFMASVLPAYMVPSAFMQIDEMPLNLNAKIDKEALPDIDFKGMEHYVAPANEKESALCEVFAKILGLDRVSADASFFELGGDSIKGIQVASGVLEYGYRMQMRQLFQTPSAREMAPYLTRAGIVEEDSVSGEAPLSGIQTYFFELDFENKQHWNQSVLLEAKESLDYAVMEHALQELCEYHDELRARFYQEDGKWIQEIQKAGEGSFYRLTEADEKDAKMQMEAASVSHLLDREKLHAVILRGTGRDKLFLSIHHLVVDTVSWRILLADLQKLYLAGLNAGQEILPAKTTSYFTYTKALQSYVKSDAIWAESEYWRRVMQEEYTSLPTDGHLNGTRRLKNQKRVSLDFDREQTDRIKNAAASVYGIQMNELLLTALMSVLKQQFGVEKTSILMEGHGRENFDEAIDISRTVGWFTDFYPVILTGRDTTEETLYSIKEQLRQIPSNGFSYVVLKYFTEQEFHILPQIQMNYLGEFDHNAGQEEEFFTSQSIENTYDMDENSPCMTKLAITGSILQNCLSLSVEYDQMEYHQETMERFMQLYGQALSETADFVLEKNEKVFTPSDFGCAGMDRKDFQRICTLAGKEKEIEVIYPASEMQKGMLLLSQFYREQSYYHEQMMLVLPFQVKEDEFKLRLEEISQNYQVLRSIFAHQNMRQVYQIVLKNSGIDYRYQDIRNLGKDWEPGKELSRILRTYLEGYMKADRFQGFDAEKEVMFRCRLFRLTNEAYAVLFSFSHVILDKWSMDILLNQIFGNEKEKIRDCYGDYVHWLKVQNWTKATEFWKKQMSGALDTRFPMNGPLSGKADYQSRTWTLGEETAENIRQLCLTRNVTASTVMQCAWGKTLMKVLETDDVSFGYTFSGRPGEIPHVDEMVGMFIRTLPVRMKKSAALEEMQQMNLEIEHYNYLSSSEIQRTAHLKHPAFRYFMTFQNTPGSGDNNGIYELFNYNRSMNDFNIFIQMDRKIEVLFAYDRDKFSDTWILTLSDVLLQMIEQADKYL